MSTPIAVVRVVIVARIRCWWTPWPSWTSECRSSRMNGMSRLTASSMRAWVDGPKAERSASRMSRSSSASKSKAERGRVDQVVDEGDRDPAGLDPDRLLAELVDDVVLAVRPGRAGLAVADVRPGEVLELEGDVLGDVAGPGPVAEAGDEAAPPAERAGVVLERGQDRRSARRRSRGSCSTGTPRGCRGRRASGRPARGPSSSGRAGSGSRRSSGSAPVGPRRRDFGSVAFVASGRWLRRVAAGRPRSSPGGRLPRTGHAASPPRRPRASRPMPARRSNR